MAITNPKIKCICDETCLQKKSNKDLRSFWLGELGGLMKWPDAHTYNESLCAEDGKGNIQLDIMDSVSLYLRCEGNINK